MKIKKIFALICFIFAFLFCFSPQLSYADSLDSLTTDSSGKDCKEALQELLDDGSWVEQMAAEDLKAAYLDNNVVNTVGTTFMTVKDIGIFNNTTFEAIYKAVAIVGCALVGLYFILELIEKASMGQFTIEQLSNVAIKSILGYAVISFGWQLLGYLYDAAIELADAFIIGAQTTEDLGLYKALAEDIIYIRDSSFWGCLMKDITYKAQGLIPYVCMFIAIIILWSMLVEMLVRSLFSPIAFAEIANTGINGPGMRYIKKMFATYLQFATIILAVWVCQVLQTSILATGAGTLLLNIAFELITITTVTKAASFIQGVVDR